MVTSGESGLWPVTEFVLKVTSRCDLACDHCYVYDDPQQAWRKQPKMMDLAVAERAADRIAEHAARHCLSEVAVILHGGEPLLLGQSRLLPILSSLRAAIEPVAALDLRLQTNGTLLTECLCTGLVQHGVRVGVSLDGDRTANDRHRRYAHGGSSHSQVLRGLAVLRRQEFRQAYGGLLCTVDVANDPLQVYEALLRESPPRIDFLLPHGTWDRPPPGHGYAEWLLRIYDRWVAEDRARVSVRLFESVLSLEQGGPSATESLGLDDPTVAVIETDGTWELPDSLKTVSGDAPHTGLDLQRHSVDELVHHIATYRAGLHETPTACSSCPIVTTCGGGLYAHRFGRGNGFDNPSVYCADLARLIVGIRYRQRAVPPVTGGTPTVGAWLRTLLEDGAPLESPEMIDEVVRLDRAVDHELLFTAATLAGSDTARSAWRLLVEVEAMAPDVVVSTLSAAGVRQRVREAVRAARPEVVAASDALLASVAITTAITAGHPATVEVLVTDGIVCLPGLGVISAPGSSTTGISSSTRAGEFFVRLGSETTAVTASTPTTTWSPVRTVEVDGATLMFDDVDPDRGHYAGPAAAGLTSAQRDLWVAALEQAWLSMRAAAPRLAATLGTIITTVVPSDPRTESRAASFGAVALPSAEPQGMAAALVEQAARSIVAAAHRAFGLADAHLTGMPASDVLLADAYAAAAMLRWAQECRMRGEQVESQWLDARREDLHQRLDELAHHDALTKLGRVLLDRIHD